MEPLAELLEEHRDEIEQRLHLGYVHWEDLMRKIGAQERSDQGAFRDEKAWTFLAGCGYAISGTEGMASITNILTGADLPQPDGAKIWLEVLPLPPRKREGTTHIDLAVGSIARRGNSRGGIYLRRGPQTWICFCEMKWASDISLCVTYDPNRNQLARVIENALCFQDQGRYSDVVHVALVTPAMFKRTDSEFRAYQGVFRGYESGRARLRHDLDTCRLDKRDRADWKYPVGADDRVEGLNLRWPTFEELFSGIPSSAISEGLQAFWKKYGNTP